MLMTIFTNVPTDRSELNLEGEMLKQHILHSIAQNNKLNVLLNCDFCIIDSLQKSMPFLN